eukprot:COSAG01_NODE_4362_length_5097_cov_29.636455_7_plen_81_part_00
MYSYGCTDVRRLGVLYSLQYRPAYLPYYLWIVLFGMMPCLADWLESAGSFYLKPPTGNLGTRTAGPYLYPYNCTAPTRTW